MMISFFFFMLSGFVVQSYKKKVKKSLSLQLKMRTDMKVLGFVKNWMLPIAMAAGVAAYYM